MRVLIVQPSLLFYGGAAAAVAQLSAHLKSRGIHNTIVTLFATTNFMESTRDLNLDIRAKTVSTYNSVSSKDALSKRYSRFFSDVLVLRRFIAAHKNNYDLINPHNFPSNWASVLHKKPVVWMMNEPLGIYTLPSFLPKVASQISAKCDRFLVTNYIDKICVNSYITQNQAKQIYGRTSNLVLFGIDYKRYRVGSPDQAYAKFGLDGRFVILTTGVVDPWKNQLASIKAVEKVISHIPNVLLVLTGGGDKEYITMLRDYVRRKKLDPYIIFTGFLPDSDIISLYHASHIGLYPFKEQGGLLAPFESLCAGKPIIISSTNGATELIKRYKLGIVTDNYADAIIDVYNYYGRYKNMAQSAQECVQKEFSWEKYCERLLRIFENAYATTK